MLRICHIPLYLHYYLSVNEFLKKKLGLRLVVELPLGENNNHRISCDVVEPRLKSFQFQLLGWLDRWRCNTTLSQKKWLTLS